ncbi:MAG: hypothetical protein FJ265_02460 [Planctomycetes bacterium]|nr:hypothetical protein [Planctomycetota bacterium]
MTKSAFVPSLALAVLAACGGGGNEPSTPGTIAGLQGPEQVTILESSTGATAALRLPRSVRGLAGSDYETDRTRFWVRDTSMEALDTVNMILSSLHQTRYWEQTNAGPYLALVEDTTRGEGGGERGQTGPEYEEWVVDSTRANNTAPQIVGFWIASEEHDDPVTIYGKLTVDEEPGDLQPLGRFALFFKALPESAPANGTETRFEGYLRTVPRTDGQSEVEFWMGHGDPDRPVPLGQSAQRERAHVVGDMAAGTGRAYTERRYVMNHGGQNWSEAGEYQIQFNANYVARREQVANELAVLDRNHFDTTVFRYGVYDASTEARVDQLSGFPVQTESGAHGWAGFHGIWFPQEVALVDGMTLHRRTWGSQITTPYTLVRVPGRLERRVRSSITLADLQNEDLQTFDPMAGGEVRVRFTGTDFVRIARRNGNEWQPEANPVSIASSYSTGQWLHFWSHARGSVEFAWPATLSGAAPAFVWSSTPVTADSTELAGGDLTLHGYSQLLKASISNTEANFLNGDSPYLPNATSVSSGNQTYVFVKQTLMLQLGGQDVNFAPGVTITSGPALWGLNCGPLFAAPLASLGEMQNQTVNYEWRVGQNRWSQLLALKNAEGNFVAFTPPTRFTYVHNEPGSPYDGRTFHLEWDGTNLQGVPHVQNAGDGRWYPQFNIPSGTTVTAGSRTYKIKQLEGEQSMQAVGDPVAVYESQGFDLSNSLSVTTPEPYTDPAIGERPAVTGAPTYVGGVAQNGDG